MHINPPSNDFEILPKKPFDWYRGFVPAIFYIQLLLRFGPSARSEELVSADITTGTTILDNYIKQESDRTTSY